MLLGFVVAAAAIIGMQVPLLHRPSKVVFTSAAVTPATAPTPLAWPSVGSAALDIPSLGVLESHHNNVTPIASLTKMMTAYVTLKELPLALGESGPCVTVNSEDVDLYHEMSEIGESSLLVDEGEQLCELDLLNGVLVYSAGNYAVMLADMVEGTSANFIAAMNLTAERLGLADTNYADVTGFSPLSVSTALDQAKLAALLMRSPLVRSIVNQSSVTLPVVGVVNSFTPFVGEDNVIGVKSGRTVKAGGCDVMAMTFVDGAKTHVLYAVVLGQQGGNLLTPAGDAALALAQSALANRAHHVFAKDRAIGVLAWEGRHVGFGVTTQHEVWWWSPRGALPVTIYARAFRTSIHRGEIVGQLEVGGAQRRTFALRALGDLSPPTLWQRLR